MADLVNKDGEKTGEVAKLGNEWWAIWTRSISTSSEVSIKKSLSASASATLQAAGSIKGTAEASSLTFYPKSLALSTNTPLVASVSLLPGPNIKFDNVKGKLTTNAVRLGGTKVELTSAKQRNALAQAQSVLTSAQRGLVNLDQGGVEAAVGQRIQRNG